MGQMVKINLFNCDFNNRGSKKVENIKEELRDTPLHVNGQFH
jgi:hypothetical protein